MIQFVAFVIRCTAAAVLAYVTTDALELGHPVWAVVSALVVSQGTAQETRNSFLWRAAGTVLGVGVAAPVALFLMPDLGRPLLAVATAVSICAAAAHLSPRMRVCMWTAPLVILTVSPAHSILHTAIQRCTEVMLGGTIGAIIHVAVDDLIIRRIRTDRCAGNNSG